MEKFDIELRFTDGGVVTHSQVTSIYNGKYLELLVGAELYVYNHDTVLGYRIYNYIDYPEEELSQERPNLKSQELSEEELDG